MPFAVAAGSVAMDGDDDDVAVAVDDGLFVGGKHPKKYIFQLV